MYKTIAWILGCIYGGGLGYFGSWNLFEIAVVTCLFSIFLTVR